MSIPLPPARRLAPAPSRPRLAPGPLTARVYDIDDQSQYYRVSEPRIVRAGLRLHVAATSADDGITLPLSPKVGMAVEPVVFEADPEGTGNWLIRNNGQTNTLRIQPWGLRPFPLRPQTTVAMPAQDAAVWIPVLPRGAEPGDRGETFRVVIARTPELPPTRGRTRNIIDPKRKAFTDDQMEALLFYYGEFFSWPPHPAPHVRSTAELERAARSPGSRFIDAKGRLIDPYALFRTSKSGKRDWYPPTDRHGSVETYLPAVERMVEIGSLTLDLVWRYRDRLAAAAYVAIDEATVRP